jgi:hypothetical protein
LQIYSSSSTILVPRPFRPSGGGDLSNSDQRVELLLGVFLIVPLAGILTRTRLGALWIPVLQMCLLSFTSILTSVVPIDFWANFLISLMALGAFFVKVMHFSMMSGQLLIVILNKCHLLTIIK